MDLSAQAYANLIQSPWVAIRVFQDDKIETAEFHLPGGLLKERARWLYEAAKANRKSDQRGPFFKLIGETRMAFAIFTYWLYTGTLPDSFGYDSASEPSSRLTHLLETYGLFHRMKLPKQQNMVMDRMCKIVRTSTRAPDLINQSDIIAAERNLRKDNAQLRTFVVQAFAMGLQFGSLKWFNFDKIHTWTDFVSRVWTVVKLDSEERAVVRWYDGAGRWGGNPLAAVEHADGTLVVYGGGGATW